MHAVKQRHSWHSSHRVIKTDRLNTAA
uniref:Uncharacterized protein n=1 Tax=Anguilla anguilla TaxID=7936 RepID=A0A0E9SBA2_ANGAN